MSNNDFPFGGGGNQPPAHHPQHQYQQQHAQNSTLNGATQQQMPAAMPALTPDLQALLQGVTPEQFAAIAHAFQSGSIPLPPASFAPPQRIAPTATPVNADPRLPPQPRHATNAPGARPGNGDVDMDQQDGEVEDGEVDGASTLQARGFLRTPPKGPASSRRGSHQHTNLAQNGARPGLTPRASASTIPKAIVANGKAPGTPSGNVQATLRPNKEAASKAFVLEMHKAGYTYDDLAREVKDHKMLRRLYVQLGLPIPSSSSVNAPAMSKPVAPPVNAVRKQFTAPPAKVPEKADRSAYLAKLAAVKGKKTEAAKASATPPAATQTAQPTEVQPMQLQTASPSQVLPSAAAPTTLPSVPAAQTATATTPVAKAPVLSHDKNVLLRKKLEALRAEQAAKQRAKASGEANLPSSPAPQQVAQSPRPGLGAGLTEAAATVARQNVPATVPPQNIATTFTAAPSTAGSPIVNRSGFSLPGLNLPGLFPTHTLPAAPPSSISRPNTNPPAQTPTKAVSEQQNAIGADQPTFGQRNNVNSPERHVIEVSSEDEREGEDDDDDGEAMEIDGSSEDEQAQRANLPPAVPTKAMAPVSSLPNSAGPSAPGTPNIWQRKLEEAEALRQKIAELERRRKIQPSTSAIPSPSSGGVPAALARLGNGTGASLGLNGSLDSQSKVAVETPAQQNEGLFSQPSKSDQVRAKHDSGSPALLVATGPNLQATNNATTTVDANTASDIDDDDDDDEDLYGVDDDTQVTQYQQAQDTRGAPFLESQATTVSEDSIVGTAKTLEVAAAADQADDDLHHAMDVDQTPGEQQPQTAGTDAMASDNFNESGGDDDDDLDNIYEPPSAIDVLSQAQEPDDTPAAGTHDEDSDDAMDTSEESSSDSDSDEDGRSSARPESIPAEASGSPARSLVSPTVHDEETAGAQSPVEVEVAPELQRANDDQETAPEYDEPRTQTRYTPYESALKRFKDYIYHPEFTNTVPSGFKSLTFNHKIDPNKAVCPAELYDGQCNDSTCGWQHFREMNLQDNELLRLIGTEKIPARDPEQKQRWNQGLGDLINELRSDPNVGRNAGLIAQRIAEYRRTFVKDPTRVVLVDD